MRKIKTLVLKGNKYDMGVQYGQSLKAELSETLQILKNFYIDKHKISLRHLVEKADIFYDKYPFGYQNFIRGVVKGSGIALDEIKILNAMETLNSLVSLKNELSACSFIAIPSSKSSTGSTIIGRNYDFPAPFSIIAKYLTVTILNEPDTVPTAFISMPGQIYCPSCVNKESLFIELNNGMPSGGFAINNDRESLLINLLEALQNSEKFTQLDKQLLSLNSDYSLIINVAGRDKVKSYEYSAFRGMKSFIPNTDAIHVSTNFYLNDTWEIPKVDDKSTWLGVSRRDNLLKINKVYFTLSDVMEILDTKLTDGGATWNSTIYQMVFDTKSNDLYLKITQEDDKWTHIPLNNLFEDTTHQTAYDEL